MKIEKIKISDIVPNKNNPRIIKEDKFYKLVESIKTFPEMLSIRPLVIDEKNVVLGGNMRLKACLEVGLKDIPVIRCTNWSKKRKEEFIIKDNVGFGEWDWNKLANEWDDLPLVDWALDVWQPDLELDLDAFFSEDDQEGKEGTLKIILEYSEEDYHKIIAAFEKLNGSKEKIVYDMLLI